jgi:RNA polymerase sigma factor (sigma-70 family)
MKNERGASPSDAEILREFAAGTKDGFHLLVARYERRVATYLKRYFKLDDRAQDITQETFLRLFLHVKRHGNVWPEGESIAPMLMLIAAHAAIDDVRSERTRLESDTKFAFFSVEEPAWAEAAASASAIGVDVQRALAALPADFREVARLYFLNGYTGIEVAERTKLPLATAWTKIYRARRLLTTRLQKYWKGAGHDLRIPATGGARQAAGDPSAGLHRERDATDRGLRAEAEAPLDDRDCADSPLPCGRRLRPERPAS